MTTSTEVKGKHHFCGASLKAKALRMSNAFRHAPGLPLIEMGDHDTFKGEIASNPGPVSGELHILPIHLFAQPVTSNVQASSSEKENSGDVKELLPDGSVLRLSLTITTTKLDHTTTAIDDDIIHVQEVGIQGSALSGSASSSTRFFHFIPR
ncbi:hypothetical protein P692DRAFT_20888542 [Suillus brevipes Sb2]|nr:hypothetical protein P692DRAFT_20888542 [Suillus brevipes Sb2]